jgi:CRP-like cAMP-binding protein
MISRTLLARSHSPIVTSGGRVRLLDVEPDFARFLNDDERAEIRGLTLPVVRADKDEPEVTLSVASGRAFGALVLEGMLLQRLRLGEHETMRLIGPGDLLAIEAPRSSTLVAGSGRRAIADTRLAILGHDFLVAARHWPGLIVAFHIRALEQAERVSAQVAICQLPRVADRVLAMMWLLAESWGRVTASGVTLPVVLTHEALGALIGARRPTVSLALAELTERGAIVRQQTGWLLLENLPEAVAAIPRIEPPTLVTQDESSWIPSAPAPPAPARVHPVGRELFETVLRLREEVGRSCEETHATLAEVRSNRERITSRRARVAEDALRRRGAPSSG